MKEYTKKLIDKLFQNSQTTKFVIVSTQRSGTTFLSQLLNSHPDIYMGQELFKFADDIANVDEDNYRYAHKKDTPSIHLDNFYSKYAKTNHAIGFTIMFGQLENYPELLTYLEKNNILCIYLERENRVKTAFSRLKARKTNIYHTTTKIDSNSIKVDPTLLLDELNSIDNTIDKLRAFTRSLTVLNVIYEEIQQKQDIVLKEIQQFLSISYRRGLDANLVKTSSENLKSEMSNYDEIYNSLDNTIYKQYLEENNVNSLIGEGGGAWSEETHMKLHAKNFNRGLAEYIIDNIKPKNSLEFGSGLGFLSRYIVDNSSIEEAYCIEPNEIKGHYREDAFPKLLPLNIFDDEIPKELDKKFDLVFSIEVAEHIERKKHSKLFDFLISRSENWIVFSGARVGQGGLGHIAERDKNEWRKEFTDRGFLYMADMSQKIRQACDKKNINHRKNLMVFKKSLNAK